mgnify:CR=1 FL=1
MMRLRSAIAAAVAAALVAACSVGKPYQRPELKVPENFRGQSAAPDAKSLADLAWWDLYKDPALEKLIRTALEQNYDVRIALARVEEFRAQSGVAGLGSIPQVGIGGAATHSRITTVGPNPLPSTTRPVRTTYTAEIDVAYEVDLWGRISSINAAARADFIASEFARDATRVAVLSSVASTYFALRALDQQLAVSERTLAGRVKFLELTRAQFARGVVSGLDVNRAEASVATARAVIPELKSQIAQAENQLQLLLGENPAPIVRAPVAQTEFLPALPQVPTGLPASLLERRPDLRQAETTLIGANARLNAVKASLFPTVALTGSFGSQSAQLANLFTGPAKIWSFGASLLQPIIDVNRNVYQVDIYSAREKQVMLQYEQTVAQAFREVADALAAREGNLEALSVQDQQVAALRAAREQVLKRYAVGYSSYFEVIDADNALFVAELARVTVYRNTLSALVQLYKALGGGWQVAAAP